MSEGSAASLSGAKPSAGPLVPATNAASVDERIEHQVEELAPHLEAGLLRAGGGLAGERRERVAEIGAGQSEDGDEAGRQRAAVVEEAVERIGDVELVAAQGAIRQRLLVVRLPKVPLRPPAADKIVYVRAM